LQKGGLAGTRGPVTVTNLAFGDLDIETPQGVRFDHMVRLHFGSIFHAQHGRPFKQEGLFSSMCLIVFALIINRYANCIFKSIGAAITTLSPSFKAIEDFNGRTLVAPI